MRRALFSWLVLANAAEAGSSPLMQPRLRRQVRRARAGVIGPGNPRIPVRAWADALEQGIVMNMLEREELRKQIEEEKRQEAEQQQRVLEYNRWCTGPSSDCPRPRTRTARSPRSSWR